MNIYISLVYRTKSKDRMRLYRHAARCPWSIQVFLKYNPVYWCFIPITVRDAMEQDRHYVLPSSLIIHDTINPTSIGSRYRQHIQETPNTRSDEQVRSCIRQIPPLPLNYTFSICQRVEQFQYFKNRFDITIQPNSSIDIFNASIIAVCKYFNTIILSNCILIFQYQLMQSKLFDNLLNHSLLPIQKQN